MKGYHDRKKTVQYFILRGTKKSEDIVMCTDLLKEEPFIPLTIIF
jgi:hypothetical protein